jgi:S-adenosylhomocysteine hydrolase
VVLSDASLVQLMYEQRRHGLGRLLTVTAKGGSRASLAGRTVVITGGGRGIGAATAIALAEAGARVAVAARN